MIGDLQPLPKLALKDLPPINLCQLQNGETYAYRTFGKGPKTLLFLSGYGGDSVLDGLVLRHFDQEQYTILDPEIRGVGDSSLNKETEHLFDLVEDIRQFLEALGVKKVDGVVGLSMGGAIGSLFAGKHPEISDKLALIVPVPLTGIIRPEVLNEFNIDIVRERDRKGFIEYMDEDTYKEAEKRLANFRTEETFLSHVFALNNLDSYKDIKSKVLVLQGDRDELFKVAAGELIVQTIGTDKATLKVLEDCGHFIRLEKAPMIVKLISEFMEADGKQI